MSSLISGYSIYCSFYSAKATNATAEHQIKYSAARAPVGSVQHNQQHIIAAKQARKTASLHRNYVYNKSATEFTYAVSNGSFLMVDTHPFEEGLSDGAVRVRSTEIRMRASIAAGNFR